MRLIDADALEPHEVYMNYGCQRIVYMDDIDEAPTIDAEPREIGHWLPYEFGDYHWHKCSVCGKADKYIETIGNGDLQAIRHFCPICGARMEIEENERKRANETNTTI